MTSDTVVMTLALSAICPSPQIPGLLVIPKSMPNSNRTGTLDT